MRSILIFLLLTGAGIVTWLVVARPEKMAEEPKQQAIAVSKHSEAFNGQITSLLKDYYAVGEKLVGWDSAGAKGATETLMKSLDNTALAELKDSTILLTAQTFIDNAKGEVSTIISEGNIRPQREAFNRLTDAIYQFLNTVQYDREKLYLQECPMAFDDTEAAQWISEKPEIRNPYLGLYHPTYGKGMLACGETKKTINHTGKE